MKRIILIAALALGLAGCANGFNPFASYSNPITTSNLYEGELAFDASLKTFNALKDLCARRVIPSKCRTYVIQAQDLIRRAADADNAARDFVTKYPTLDSTNVVQAFTGLVAQFKATNTALGGQ